MASAPPRAWLAALALAACAPPPSGPPLEQRHATAAPRPPRSPAQVLTDAIAAGAPAAILEAASAAAPDEVAAAAPAIAQAVAALAPGELATVAARLPTDRAPAGAMALRLADLARRAGDREGRARWLAVAEAAPDRDPDAVRALAGRAAVDPSVVAVLLPLSGPHAAVGRALAQAIALAPVDQVAPLILDTAGDPEGAARAVEAADAAGAVLALGPVGARESAAARARAIELGLPLALLSPSDPPPAPGQFNLLDSPTTEAAHAAQVAAALGVGTVAVLAPRDDVGAAAAAAFVAAAEALGLTVVARGDYALETRTLGPDVKAFLGLDPTTNPRLAAHLRRHGKRGWQTFSPDVGFALLYIPDRYDRAALVASFLPYYGVELHTDDFLDLEMLARKHGGRVPQVVQLLGSSGWNDPGLLTRGGPAVEGALIVEPCAIDPADPSPFAEAFAAAHKRPPSPIAAAAADAWRLAARARPSRGADLRARQAAALGTAGLTDGACGEARMGDDGRIDRTPTVLRVDAGELAPYPL